MGVIYLIVFCLIIAAVTEYFWLIAAAIIIAVIINLIKRFRAKSEIKKMATQCKKEPDKNVKEVGYSFPTKIAGVSFGNIQQILPELKRGMHLTFVREPDNPYDTNAVAIVCNGNFIGHLKADVAADIAPIMDRRIMVDGEIINITGGNGKTYGCNIKVNVYKK